PHPLTQQLRYAHRDGSLRKAPPLRPAHRGLLPRRSTGSFWQNRRLRSFQALQPILIRSASMLLLAGEECLGFPRFRPLGIGILRQIHYLAVVLRCFMAIARRIRGTGNAQERAVAVWRLLERRLELV